MKFMITIYDNDTSERAFAGAERDEFERVHGSTIGELMASGELVHSSELDLDGAKVVRVTDGRTTVTDGPFTEGREVVGGYYLVDVAGVDRAVEIASRFVEARYCPIEVRALVEYEPS